MGIKFTPKPERMIDIFIKKLEEKVPGSEFYDHEAEAVREFLDNECICKIPEDSDNSPFEHFQGGFEIAAAARGKKISFIAMEFWNDVYIIQDSEQVFCAKLKKLLNKILEGTTTESRE